MTAQIINGKNLSLSICNDLKQAISNLKKSPILAVIIIGKDPASEIYVRNKEEACLRAGIIPKTFHLPQNTNKDELIRLIDQLNTDPEINGILVQLPLPTHLDEQEVLSCISPLKDVDGFHPLNTGKMIQKQPNTLLPCTPKGILRLIKSVKPNIDGLNAVVIGRSKIVGLPTAHLLLNENCTVTIAHSHTQDLPQICRTADILVVAIGKPEFITKDYIKNGAIIIDVGINRQKDGIIGDVKFSECTKIASYITPVPGGVGPMTIAMLVENTYLAFLNQSIS